MIEKLGRSAGAVLGFKMSGKLHDEDYQQFVPLVKPTEKRPLLPSGQSRCAAAPGLTLTKGLAG
jgi:hypothetical protein